MIILVYFLLSFIFSVLYDRKSMRRISIRWLIGFLCMGIGLLLFGCIAILLLLGWRDGDVPTSWWITAGLFISIGLLLGILCRLQDSRNP